MSAEDDLREYKRNVSDLEHALNERMHELHRTEAELNKISR